MQVTSLTKINGLLIKRVGVMSSCLIFLLLFLYFLRICDLNISEKELRGSARVNSDKRHGLKVHKRDKRHPFFKFPTSTVTVT